MTTVKVKFRPSTVEDRPGTIVYLVTHRRIARQITTSYKVFPCEWDEERSAAFTSRSILFPHPQTYILSDNANSFFLCPHTLQILLDAK